MNTNTFVQLVPNPNQTYAHDLPPAIIEKWQKTVDLIAALLEVVAVRITCLDSPDSFITFISSQTEGNPYHSNEKFSIEADLYCKTVLAKRTSLLVPDIAQTERAAYKLDVERGMISYLGFPLTWPNGLLFGTLDVLDSKEHPYSPLHQQLVQQFQVAFDTDLLTIYQTKQFEFISRIGNDSFWEWNLATDKVSWSQYFYKVIGTTSLTGSTSFAEIRDRIHPDDHETINKKLRAHFQYQQPFSVEYRFRHDDGHYIWLLTKGEAIRNAQGKIVKMLGTNFDITEQKQLEQERDQAQEQLRQSEERYRQMFERSQAIKLLIDVTNGTIVDANSAACEFYGYSWRELTNLKNSDINTLSKEQIELAMAQAVSEQCNHFKFVHRLASGELHDMEVYSSPIEIQGRKLLYSIMHDITERRQMEIALQTERDFAMQVINAVGQGLTVTDSEGRVEFINPAYAHMLGYTPEELLGKTPFDITAPQDRETLVHIWKRRLIGESNTYESRLLHRDGSTRYVTITGVPRWRDGEMIGTIAVITDLTERRKAEEAERQQKEYLAALHETTLALINRLDLTDLLQAIVSRAAALVGTPHGFIYLPEMTEPAKLGIGFYENALAQGIHFYDEIRAAKITSGGGYGMIDKVLQSGEPIIIDDYRTWPERRNNPQNDFVRATVGLPIKSGEAVVGVLVLTYIEEDRLFDKDKVELLERFAQLASLALDNARLYASAQRRLSELTTVQRVANAINSNLQLDEVFQILVDQISSAFGYEMVSVYLRSGDGLALQAYVGYNEIKPRTFLRLDQAVSGRVARTGQAIFVQDASQDADFITIVPGTQQAIIVPLKSGNGQVLGTLLVESAGRPVLTEQDFSLLTLLANQVSVAVENNRLFEERLTLERKLLETQKLESLGILAGGIAHDFNNLLVGILGNAGLALLELPPQISTRETIEQIEIAAKRAAELTHQMLAYSGKGRFIIHQVNLNALIEEMRHLLKASLNKNAILKYNLSQNLPSLEADATQLRQVVMNLLVNASDAIGDKDGVISVTTGAMWANQKYLAETYLALDLAEGWYSYLEIADTGSGMDEATQAKIFDPFFTTKFTGRGLGLAAVLGIVRGHKGALKVSSKPGVGTVFRILLPSLAPSATPLATNTPAVNPAVALPNKQGTILVIDDEELVRKMTSRLLERFGFRVYTANDGRAGLEVYRLHADEIDCVLLDMTMPYLNGKETFREISRINPQAQVILMSGYTEEETIQQFEDKGLVGFLQKPFNLTNLQEILQKIFDKL